MSLRKVQEMMSADDKIVAFDFQFTFFLYTLFTLKLQESAGFEAKEDVHIDHSDGKTTFIQVKHTVRNKPLTNKDEDLWKTIWSWVNIITENSSNSQISEIEFIKKSKFILLTNKRDSNNKILKKIQDYKTEKCDIEELIFEINGLSKGQSEVDQKIDDILEKPADMLAEFFKNISFSTEYEDIELKILNIMEEKFIDINLRQPILDMAYHSLRKKLIEVVNKGEHLVYSHKEFSTLISTYNPTWTRKLSVYDPIFEMDKIEPSSKLTFIRQLEDIEQIALDELDDREYVMDLLYMKLLYETNSKRWIQDSEVSEEEVFDVERDAVIEWRRQFKRIYREARNNNFSEAQILTLARQLFEKIEDTKIDFSMEVTSKSNLGTGLFLNLSDKPVIGWHRDWKDRYINEENI
ncbi:ABC-three component system protein [Enterococcus sp. AZ007]|uniref:ABC-three component system protein n=1 Tax=Enterococcus sp. AZ007 TaxID=2774839 RepID=UPI003F2845EB